MFVVRLSWRLWPAGGVTSAFSPRVQHVHKLASLQKVPAMPPKKLQNLLYPFSQLESYLDRCPFEIAFIFLFISSMNATFSLTAMPSSRSVDRTQFELFHPSVEDMVKAEKLFCSASHRIDYYVSAERMDHAPALKQPEVRRYNIDIFTDIRSDPDIVQLLISESNINRY